MGSPAMIEVVVTTGLARTKRIGAARSMDRVSRVVFPGLLVVLGLYAFAWH